MNQFLGSKPSKILTFEICFLRFTNTVKIRLYEGIRCSCIPIISVDTSKSLCGISASDKNAQTRDSTFLVLVPVDYNIKEKLDSGHHL